MDKENSKWASLRDFCSAIREVVIVAAMLSLLVVPAPCAECLSGPAFAPSPALSLM